MTHGRSLTLDGLLRRAAAKSPDKVAYRCDGAQRTYAQMDDRVNRLARALQERGVQRGDRVCVVMTNRLEAIEVYWAGCRLGAIVTPVNFRLVAAEVAYVFEDCGAKAVVVDVDLAPVVAQV